MQLVTVEYLPSIEGADRICWSAPFCGEFFGVCRHQMPSYMRGRWHGEAVTDEVEAAVSMRRCPPHQSPPATASPHRGSHWSAFPKASPLRGGGTAIAVTERSYQICGNLSVTFGDSSPGRGAFPRKKVTPIKILVALSIDGNRSKATSCKPDTPVSGGA